MTLLRISGLVRKVSTSMELVAVAEDLWKIWSISLNLQNAHTLPSQREVAPQVLIRKKHKKTTLSKCKQRDLITRRCPILALEKPIGRYYLVRRRSEYIHHLIRDIRRATKTTTLGMKHLPAIIIVREDSQIIQVRIMVEARTVASSVRLSVSSTVGAQTPKLISCPITKPCTERSHLRRFIPSHWRKGQPPRVQLGVSHHRLPNWSCPTSSWWIRIQMPRFARRNIKAILIRRIYCNYRRTHRPQVQRLWVSHEGLRLPTMLRNPSPCRLE